MSSVLIGYMTWNVKTGKPYVGTRRRKVWTTEAQCEGHEVYFNSGHLKIVPVYAEVPDEPAPLV